MNFVSPEDSDRYLTFVRERWGLPDDFFEGYRLIAPNTKTINIINADLNPVDEPSPESCGLPFLRVKMIIPKITTAAALWIGPHATKAIVTLSKDRTDRFFRREDLELQPEDVCDVDYGYVLVKCGEMTVSVALLKDGILQNMHPKAWSIGEGISAFSF